MSRRFGVRVAGLAFVVPYFTEAGELYREKAFSFAPASGACRTIWLGDHKPQIPYGLETLKLGGHRCFLTEGESDSWALRLAYQRTPVLECLAPAHGKGNGLSCSIGSTLFT